MSRISVIVPVYNMEDTLERCVNSILGQMHSDLDDVLREMQTFEREHLRCVDKRGWKLRFIAPMVLVRSKSTASFAVGYYLNQLAIRLFAGKSGTRR